MREIDEEERREAIMERRSRFQGCKCGNPDWPGSCPGWQFCPVHGENESDEGDEEVCETCGGEDEIDQRIGGEPTSATVPCPDCAFASTGLGGAA